MLKVRLIKNQKYSKFEYNSDLSEVDVWDGESEPIVYHGHTLTKKIYFRDIIKLIEEFAFKVSEYPLILSIENHCNLEQQKQMASIMISILGGN